MKYLAYILTGVIVLSACSRYSFNEEIATLDSLVTDYNKLKILVDSMSNIQSKHYLTAYTKDIKVLKKSFI